MDPLQIYWLLPSFLLFALAFGGTIVPKINLILSLLCSQYFCDRAVEDPGFMFSPVLVGGDNPQCQTPEVQAMVSNFTLVTNLLSGILAALTAPMLGAYSDRHGRIWVIVLTSVGSFVSEIITITVARNPKVFSVYWMFLGYSADGLCGSFILAMALSNAYASDCTPPEKRAISFGLFHGCLFSGIAFGPIIAAYIIRLTGNLLSIFYVSLATHVCFVIFLALVVPESLTKERRLAARQKWAEQKASGLGHGGRRSRWSLPVRILARVFNGEFFAALRILRPTGAGASAALRRNLVLLAAIDTSMFGVGMGAMTVIIIYSEYIFHWDTADSSMFISVVNICRVTMLVVGLPLITRVFRRGSCSGEKQHGCDGLDLAVIRIAVLFDMLGFVGYGTARQGWMFVTSGALAAVGGMGSPTLQSALTKHVPPDRTGQLLGAISLLHAMARVIAPTLFNGLYSVTVVRGFPQAVFVLLAAVFGLCAAISWFLRPNGEPLPLHLSRRSMMC